MLVEHFGLGQEDGRRTQEAMKAFQAIAAAVPRTDPSQLHRLTPAEMPLPTKAEDLTPRQQEALPHNVHTHFFMASPEHMFHGHDFYPLWNRDQQGFRSHLDATQPATSISGIEGPATLTAHLSPAKESELNRLAAYQMVHLHMSNSGDRETLAKMQHHMDEATRIGGMIRDAKAATSRKSYTGKPFVGSDEHKSMVEAVLHHDTAMKQLRDGFVIKGTPLFEMTGSQIASGYKALHLPPQQALSTLGDLKISDFAGMIRDPRGHPTPPNDTHFVDAMQGQTNVAYKTLTKAEQASKAARMTAQGKEPVFRPGEQGDVRGVSNPNRYRLITAGAHEGFARVHETLERYGVANAYEDALAHMGVSPQAGGMGTVWYSQQDLKSKENPGSMATRKAAATKIINFRQFAQSTPGHESWLPESHGMAPTFVKIAH